MNHPSIRVQASVSVSCHTSSRDGGACDHCGARQGCREWMAIYSVIQPEEHATVRIDGRPPLKHFPKSLALHGEIGAPPFMYDNLFVHVLQCLQEFDGMKVRSFHIDSPWPWPVRDVIPALPLHLAGTICTIAPLVILRATWIHHSVATATNGRLALGMAEKHQLKGKAKESCSYQ